MLGYLYSFFKMKYHENAIIYLKLIYWTEIISSEIALA